MQPAEAIDHVRMFVQLQRRLWQALRAIHGEPLGPGLTALPKSGQVRLDDEPWEFRKHGSGILFLEVGGKRRVDLHDVFAGPDHIDAWRLATYFGALGRTGEKLVSQAAGTSGTLQERLAGWLEELSRRGVLRVDRVGYRFISEEG